MICFWIKFAVALILNCSVIVVFSGFSGFSSFSSEAPFFFDLESLVVVVGTVEDLELLVSALVGSVGTFTSGSLAGKILA